MKLIAKIWIGGAFAALAAAANAATLQGKVTDSAGAALRGVLVKATVATHSVARFTDAQGEYRIDNLPDSALTVTTRLTGYVDQTLTVDAGSHAATDLKLVAKWDSNQLSSAEILTAMPDNAELRWLQARCISCHGLSQPEHVRGLPEEGWKAILSAMTMSYGRDDLTDAEKSYAAKLTTKYFGAGAPPLTAATVTRVPIDDAALQATYYEMDLPTPRALPHSIVADNKGNAWVAEFAGNANNIAKWNFAAHTIEEIPLKIPKAGPHTPTIGADGRVWTALLYGKQVTVTDPKTMRIDYIPLDMNLPHTLSTDAQGNIWGNGTRIYRVDPNTQKVTYWAPIKLPEPAPTSWEELGRLPGTPVPKNQPLYAYHAVADSKGMVWYTALETGWLVRLDPRSGEQKVFTAPGVNASRGLTVDSHDNVWYTNWSGHGLARLNQSTGKIDLFKSPTKFAMPYSVFEDKKRGYLWMSDYNGNNLTRLDPKTGTFVEYPLPSRECYPRFISVDNDGRVWFAEWWQSRVGLLDPYPATAQSAASSH